MARFVLLPFAVICGLDLVCYDNRACAPITEV